MSSKTGYNRDVFALPLDRVDVLGRSLRGMETVERGARKLRGVPYAAYDRSYLHLPGHITNS